MISIAFWKDAPRVSAQQTLGNEENSTEVFSCLGGEVMKARTRRASGNGTLEQRRRLMWLGVGEGGGGGGGLTRHSRPCYYRRREFGKTRP